MNNVMRTPEQNRKLHFLCSRLGIDREMLQTMVWNYTCKRTTHSKEMYKEECQALINFLDDTLKPKTERKTAAGRADVMTIDRKRKGVIKAIFAYLESTGMQPSMEYVKAIACRAAGKDDFNKLSPAELTRIYAEFCKKQQAAAVKQEIVKRQWN